MDPRLVPLNGVLGLLAPGHGEAWPNVLAEQGYRLHLIEGDVQSDPQSIRADVIAYRTRPDVVLLIECKSGRSIRSGQARAYVNADAHGLRRRGTLPGELEASPDIEVIAMFAGRDEDGDALAESMRRENIAAPLLLVGRGGASLRGSSHAALNDFEARDAAYALPPGRVLVDHESSVEEVRELLLQEVGVAMSQGRDVLDLQDAASAIHPYWSHVGRVAQQRFVDLLKEGARSLASGDLRGDVDYESSNAVSPRLVFRTRPAEADPRGAPQAWQSLARRAASTVGRAPRPTMEGQLPLAFDDVADEAVPTEPDDQDTVDE